MNIEKIILNGFSFYLEDFGDGKGKITITGNCENYSHYWGKRLLNNKIPIRNGESTPLESSGYTLDELGNRDLHNFV